MYSVTTPAEVVVITVTPVSTVVSEQALLEHEVMVTKVEEMSETVALDVIAAPEVTEADEAADSDEADSDEAMTASDEEEASEELSDEASSVIVEAKSQVVSALLTNLLPSGVIKEM